MGTKNTKKEKMGERFLKVMFFNVIDLSERENTNISETEKILLEYTLGFTYLCASQWVFFKKYQRFIFDHENDEESFAFGENLKDFFIEQKESAMKIIKERIPETLVDVVLIFLSEIAKNLELFLDPFSGGDFQKIRELKEIFVFLSDRKIKLPEISFQNFLINEDDKLSFRKIEF